MKRFPIANYDRGTEKKSWMGHHGDKKPHHKNEDLNKLSNEKKWSKDKKEKKNSDNLELNF